MRLVTFTGSIPVGKHLTALAGAHMKPVIMELSGHSPMVVCDDVDPMASAVNAAVAKSRNAGQVCVAPTRFFVEDAIYDRFTAAMTEKAASITVGNGLDPANQMGPLANERRMAAMEMLVADAKDQGRACGDRRQPNRKSRQLLSAHRPCRLCLHQFGASCVRRLSLRCETRMLASDLSRMQPIIQPVKTTVPGY